MGGGVNIDGFKVNIHVQQFGAYGAGGWQVCLLLILFERCVLIMFSCLCVYVVNLFWYFLEFFQAFCTSQPLDLK